MGSPTYPSAAQLAQLKAASTVVKRPLSVSRIGNACSLTISKIELHAVVVVAVD